MERSRDRTVFACCSRRSAPTIARAAAASATAWARICGSCLSLPQQTHGMASHSLEVRRVRLAAFTRKVITDVLALIERREPRTLDGANVDEHVRSAVFGLNEAEAFRRVEPFHLACRHHVLLFAVPLPFASSQSIVRSARKVGPARYSWMLTG